MQGKEVEEEEEEGLLLPLQFLRTLYQWMGQGKEVMHLSKTGRRWQPSARISD